MSVDEISDLFAVRGHQSFDLLVHKEFSVLALFASITFIVHNHMMLSHLHIDLLIRIFGRMRVLWLAGSSF